MSNTTKTYVARSPAPLAKAVVAWTWVKAAVLVAILIVSVVRGYALGHYPNDMAADWLTPPPGMETIEVLDVSTGLILVIIWALSGFLALKWIYRVSMNAHVLANDLSVSPPWAVGWFFVPVANLFKPFTAVSEVWRVSANPTSWREEQTPTFINTWWGFWVAAWLIERAGGRWEMKAENIEMLRLAIFTQTIGAILSLVACVLFVRLVGRLSTVQHKILQSTPATIEAAPGPVLTT